MYKIPMQNGCKKYLQFARKGDEMKVDFNYVIWAIIAGAVGIFMAMVV